MKKKRNLFVALIAVAAIVAAGAMTLGKSSKKMDSKNNTVQAASAADAFVEIKTSEGDIKVRLFGDTPKHRDNFLKLVKEGYYDNVLFHRVINELDRKSTRLNSWCRPATLIRKMPLLARCSEPEAPVIPWMPRLFIPVISISAEHLRQHAKATRLTRNAVLQARNSISLQERLIMIQPFPRWNGRWK